MQPISKKISTSQTESIIKKIFKKKDLLVVIGNRTAVSELFIKKIKKFHFKNNWFTCESDYWHIHTKFKKIDKISFIEKPKHNNSGKVTYSVVLKGRNNHRLLQAFFRQDKKAFNRIKKYLKIPIRK